MIQLKTIGAALAAGLLLAACGGERGAEAPAASSEREAAETASGTLSRTARETTGQRVLLWGDTHLHTKYSGDAYGLLNRSMTPDDAYRFAKGMPVIHPYTRARVQLKTPLDFLVVSDHAEYMGVMQLAEVKDPAIMASETGRFLVDALATGRGREAFVRMASSLNNRTPIEELLTDDIRQPIWDIITDAADRHNEPGQFTALIGWEWSSLPNGANLHRVVFTPDSADTASKYLPFSSLTDDRPEALWAWLEQKSSALDARFVAIPHNSNISLGLMFDDTQSDGSPIDAAYANTRMKWEPVLEMVQVKGASETHPLLSPEDEFAGFEIYEKVMDFTSKVEGGTGTRGNYARDALRLGLELEVTAGANPYQFGMIGSTDMHTGISTAEEDNFWGKYPVDSIPDNKFDKQATPNAYGIDMGAQGLAAVWADNNSRDSIYEAFRRKEVYATSGPRIRLRVFAGWQFDVRDADANNIAEVGYAGGVPMGSDLTPGPDGEAPRLLIHAVRDPQAHNLDRIQVIKGWLNADGSSSEKIYNVIGSDNRIVQADGSLDPLPVTVNPDTARTGDETGATQLAAVWTDPDFDPSQNAFYYVRVLQIPTARHSLFDAIALQREHPAGYESVIQERAYSSPIWYHAAD